MPYRAWATDDEPSGADFNAIWADPVQADVEADEVNSGAGYVSMNGPAVQVTLVKSQACQVWTFTECLTAYDGAHGLMSWKVSGASLRNPVDTDAAHYGANKQGNNTTGTVWRVGWFAAQTGGTHAIEAYYRQSGGPSEANMHFLWRRLIAKKY